MERIFSEAASEDLVRLFFKASIYPVAITELAHKLTEELDMATKKRIRNRTARKAPVEAKVAAPQNGCEEVAARPTRAKSPFDISFNYNAEGGHFHLSFHGME